MEMNYGNELWKWIMEMNYGSVYGSVVGSSKSISTRISKVIPMLKTAQRRDFLTEVNSELWKRPEHFQKYFHEHFQKYFHAKNGVTVLFSAFMEKVETKS